MFFFLVALLTLLHANCADQNLAFGGIDGFDSSFGARGQFDSFAHDTNSPPKLGSCEVPHEFPTFIRILKVHKDGPAAIVRQMESLTSCADMCRLNMDRVESRPFDCHGFSVVGGGSEKRCEFFDENTDDVALRVVTSIESPSNYFERVCLATPEHCTGSAFSFELHRNKILNISPIESIIVDDRKRCLNFCLSNSNCHAVNFNQHNGSCQVLDKTCHSVIGGLDDYSGVDHYENTCAQEINRCLPGQRVDFFVTEHAEVQGLDVSLGTMSLRNCMRECLESTLMFCRSVQFDSVSGECFIVEEQSESSVYSATFTLYEPVCLSGLVDVPCAGDYVFRRTANANLIAEGFIKSSTGPKIDYCMTDCLLDDSCVSIVFDRNSRNCRLYASGARNELSKVVTDLNTDFYELACERQSIYKNTESRKTTTAQQRRETKSLFDPETENTPTTSSPLDDCNGVLIEHGRTLRLDFRNLHHVNVRTFDQCQNLCATARIRCFTFAFNRRSKECLISSTLIEKRGEYDTQTQANYDTDLYSFTNYERCGSDVILGDHTHPASTFYPTPAYTWSVPTVDRSSTTFVHESVQQSTVFTTAPTITAAAVLESASTVVQLPEEEFNFDSTFFDITKHNVSSQTEDVMDLAVSTPFIEDNSLFEVEQVETTTLPTRPTTARFFSASETPSTATWITSRTQSMSTVNVVSPNIEIVSSNIGNRRHFDPQVVFAETTISIVTDPPSTTPTATDNFDEFVEPEVIPHRLMENTRNHKVMIEDVEVKAVCLDHGVNVTYTVKGVPYTGAVYAAERYFQCKIMVTNQNSYSIFINRPSQNNWCNALETDDTMTVVLVMSNDLVMPLDVTTKDDFFFQITCDYREQVQSALIHSGVVVGGPEPKSVLSTLQHEDKMTRVNLRILKDARPVTNVFIGEKLTAAVESDTNATRIRVSECNATRVGGREPLPNSVQLIADGCTLMPQVISNMEIVEAGLQATLMAFRIDGSDQIDIACNVVICRRACERRDTCDVILERHRRTVGLRAPSPVRIATTSQPVEDMVTVDQRLRVLVENEDIVDTAAGGGGLKSNCLDPSILLIVLVLLLVSLVALAVSFCSARFRRRQSLSVDVDNSFARIEPIHTVSHIDSRLV